MVHWPKIKLTHVILLCTECIMICGDVEDMIGWVDKCDLITGDTSPWYHDSSARRSLLNWKFVRRLQLWVTRTAQYTCPTCLPRQSPGRHVQCGPIFRPRAPQARGGRWALTTTRELINVRHISQNKQLFWNKCPPPIFLNPEHYFLWTKFNL